jgi:hypothetical protein
MQLLRQLQAVLLPPVEMLLLAVTVRIQPLFRRPERIRRHRQEPVRVAQEVEVLPVEEVAEVRRLAAAVAGTLTLGEPGRFLSARAWPICPKWQPY